MCFWAWIFKNLDTLERLHVDCRLLNRQHQQICHWLQHPSKATRQDVGIGITHLHDMWFCSKQKDSFLVLFFSSSFWISWAKINFQTYIYIYIISIHMCSSCFSSAFSQGPGSSRQKAAGPFVSAYKRPLKRLAFPWKQEVNCGKSIGPNKNAPHSVVSSRFGMRNWRVWGEFETTSGQNYLPLVVNGGLEEEFFVFAKNDMQDNLNHRYLGWYLELYWCCLMN